MKKILLYLLSFIFVCFVIPAILTKNTVTTGLQENNISKERNDVNQDNSEQSTNKNDKITLLHKKTGDTEVVNIEEYLYHVVSAEMPADYELEALKAQAIVARTYTLYKSLNKKHDNADLCDDSTCCQAWITKEDRFARWEESKRETNWNKICNAVDSTKGKVILYDNKPIEAFFHSNSGGTTEIPVNVWGGSGYPYLQSVQTSGEDGYTQYSSEVIISNQDCLNKLKEKYSDIAIDFSKEDDIKVIENTESNRAKTIKFGNHNLSGVETRSIFGLRSTNFEINRDGENIKFSVKGYGHGVGMSQTGADSMAKQGKNSEEIINHFYTGIEIKDINSL